MRSDLIYGALTHISAASRLTDPATPFLNYTLPSIIDLPPNLPPQVNCDYRRTERKKYY
jgi:hypothetical protein